MKSLILTLTLITSINTFSNNCTQEKANKFIKENIEQMLFPAMMKMGTIKKIYKNSLKISLAVISGDIEDERVRYAVGLYSFKLKEKEEKKKRDYLGYTIIDLETCNLPYGDGDYEMITDELMKLAIRPGVSTKEVYKAKDLKEKE